MSNVFNHNMNLCFCLTYMQVCEWRREGGQEREKSVWGLEGSVVCVCVSLCSFWGSELMWTELRTKLCFSQSWALLPAASPWVWHMCFFSLYCLGYLPFSCRSPTCCSCIKHTRFPHRAKKGRGGKNRCRFALVQPWTESKSSLWFEPDRFPPPSLSLHSGFITHLRVARAARPSVVSLNWSCAGREGVGWSEVVCGGGGGEEGGPINDAQWGWSQCW